MSVKTNPNYGDCEIVLMIAKEMLSVMEDLLAHDFAEECQECGIGQSKAWREAKKAINKAKGII